MASRYREKRLIGSALHPRNLSFFWIWPCREQENTSESKGVQGCLTNFEMRMLLREEQIRQETG